jgi:hypothetical protein
MDIDKHLKEITRLRREADALVDDNPHGLMTKIDLLARCLTYIGRLSSYLDGEYKRIYAKRKHEQALAEIHSKPPRQANAEIAVAPLRLEEAKAYEMMHRWRNAFEATQEEIHALKLRMRIDFADGGSNVYVSPSPQAQAQTRQ